MSSGLVAVNLNFRSTDLAEDDMSILIELMEGLGQLEVRGKDTLVPALDGLVTRPRRPDRRRVPLLGSIRGVGDTEEDRQAAFWTMYKAVEDLFDPAADAADLIATLADGTIGTLAYTRALPGLQFDIRVPNEWAAVSVVLESVSPNWVYA